MSRGLYAKYDIPADSFLLKPKSDPAARVALRAYAYRTDNEELASDLNDWLDKIKKDSQTV